MKMMTWAVLAAWAVLVVIIVWDLAPYVSELQGIGNLLQRVGG